MKVSNVCFSPNGETKRIAELFGSRLGVDILDLTSPQSRLAFTGLTGDFLILSLPVYSQNIPTPMRSILTNLRFRKVIINVTYGGYSYGNILAEIKHSLGNPQVIGYSITTVKHAYLPTRFPVGGELYEPLISRVLADSDEPVHIPRRLKCYPTFLEKGLTDITYRLKFNHDLCTNCGICVTSCPTASIKEDITLPRSCIKCAACVNVCPTKAITGKKSLFVKIYFHKKKRTGVIVR